MTSLLGASLSIAAACAEPRQELAAAMTGGAGPGEAALVKARAMPVCARTADVGAAPLEPGRGQGVVLYRQGGRTLALVADEDERALHTVDVDTLEELAITPLDEAPDQLVALSDGRVAVSYRWANRVAVMEPGRDPETGLTELCRSQVPTEPVGLASSGDRLLVTSGHGRRLTELSARDLSTVRTEPLARAPRAVVVVDDGETAYVTHAVGGVVSAIDLRAEPRDTASIDLRVGQTGDFFEMDRRLRDANQGFALAAATPLSGAERLFAPQVSVDTGASDEPISVGYGSSEFGPRMLAPFVATVDVASKQRLTHELASRDAREVTTCTLPRSAVARGDRLWVGCAGIDQVLELDARMPDPMAVEHRRFAVGAGPEGIAHDGARLVVWSRLDHELARIDLDAGRVTRQRLARRDDSTVTALYARGRVLFHRTEDARISGGQRACASCHPDGRDDGLVWSSPDGRRQTKLLAGRVEGTAPYGWFGKHETLAEHLSATFQRLGGTGLEGHEEDLEALVHFVERMPAPVLEVTHDERVARGRQLFDDAAQGCGNCHEHGGTNGLAYDVGSAPAGRRERPFDTPSLRFLADSAPYYHDGRFASLRELLVATDGAMGHTSDLSNDDLDALESYLRTL